jgi:hypothetical protein
MHAFAARVSMFQPLHRLPPRCPFLIRPQMLIRL